MSKITNDGLTQSGTGCFMRPTSSLKCSRWWRGASWLAQAAVDCVVYEPLGTEQPLTWHRRGQCTEEAMSNTELSRHHTVGDSDILRYFRLRQVQPNLVFSCVGDSSCLGLWAPQPAQHNLLLHARQLTALL